MKRHSHGSLGILHRAALLGVLAAVAIAAGGCERALQVAPSSSLLSLMSAANSVQLNGSLELTVTVTSNGRAVDNGTLVTFSSTLGIIDPVEATTANGRATVRLRAGTISGTARIVASSGGVQSSPLEVRVGSVPARVNLSASSSAPGSATLVAGVFDPDGAAVVGVPVAFTTTSGTLASSAVTTDGLGQASNTLFGTSDAVVTATVNGIQTSTTVRFGAGGTLNVNISMSPTSPQRRQTVVFTANVTGATGSQVFVERYEWDFGGQVFVTTGNTVSKAYEHEGKYGLTLRVYGVGGSVGISRLEFYVD